MTESEQQKTAVLPRTTPDDRAPLSDRQRAVLKSLAAYDDWARPMDVGGRDGSHHSATLGGLASRGLAERKKRHTMSCYNGSTQRQKLVDNRWVVTDGHPPSPKCCCKGSCLYKITPSGRQAVEAAKAIDR